MVTLTSLVYFLLIGLVAGWLASMVMKGKRRGLGGHLVIGVIGALIGGWVFSLLGIYSAGLVGSLVTAFVGAVLLIALIRALRGI